MLTNLVGNALKYTDEGSVVVRVGCQAGRIDSSYLVLIFDVEDTGIGIAPEDQARIFDPFVQSPEHEDAGRVRAWGSASARHFVQLMGGTIQVESTPGRGSRFHVEIPAQDARSL